MIFSSKKALCLVLRDKSEFLITILYLVCIGLLIVLTFSSFSFPCFFHYCPGPPDDIEDSSFKWCCIACNFFELIWYRGILMLAKCGYIRGHASGQKKKIILGLNLSNMIRKWKQVTLTNLKSPNPRKQRLQCRGK